jgi:gliding motility-associated-like protein
MTIPELGTFNYKLLVTNAQNCQGEDEVNIIVADKAYFKVPSAFSPNGDGINDVVRPLTAGFRSIIFFKIYDRWGHLVFDMYTDRTGGWDGTVKGKMADAGVYYWHAKAINQNGEQETFKGDITLIR